MDRSNRIFAQIPMTLIKGRYNPFETTKGIVNIKRIYTFESHRKLYPHLLIQSDTQTFLGIICARHTSDFLSLLLKKILKQHHEGQKNESAEKKSHFTMQYALPSDRSCFKLILLIEIETPEQFEAIQIQLRQIFDEFQEKVQKIIENGLKNS